jgi:hypothetical protein
MTKTGACQHQLQRVLNYEMEIVRLQSSVSVNVMLIFF